jgi:hypothetical protein
VADFEDFRLMIRLSYGSTYSWDGPLRLRPGQLFRLLVLADCYEMTDCVKECAAALGSCLTYALASYCFVALPDPLKGQAHVHRLLVRAADLIASGLGPFQRLWLPGEAAPEGGGGAVQWTARLADDMKVGFLIVCHSRLGACCS